MKEILLTILIIILSLMFIMVVLLVLVAIKMKGINIRLYRYREEKKLKKENILIIYQKSAHHTTENIVEIIKDEIDKTQYGYLSCSLSKEKKDYSKYKYVIFVSPVYFQTINNHFLEQLPKKPFLMIYSGMKKEENIEDQIVNKKCNCKYSKIKVDAKSIEDVRKFIKGEIK